MPNSSDDPDSLNPNQPQYRVPHQHGWEMEFPNQELVYDSTGIAISPLERCPRCGSYTLFPQSVLLGAWASRSNILTCGACGLDYRVVRDGPHARFTPMDWAKTIIMLVMIISLVIVCVL